MTGAWLLDVNVLLGWLWPTHETHAAATTWMRSVAKEDWATCPITEMGFLRIVTKPAFSPIAPRWNEAVSILSNHTVNNPRHRFWQDSLPLVDVDRQLGNQIRGSNQITDAYLLSLAMRNGGRMVTFDYRMESLAPVGSQENKALLILRP